MPPRPREASCFFFEELALSCRYALLLLPLVPPLLVVVLLAGGADSAGWLVVLVVGAGSGGLSSRPSWVEQGGLQSSWLPQALRELLTPCPPHPDACPAAALQTNQLPPCHSRGVLGGEGWAIGRPDREGRWAWD